MQALFISWRKTVLPLCLLAFFSTLCFAEEKQPPNILVLMADDWSAPHAGILGDKSARTPVIDSLAKEGIVFENAFAVAPSCTPSRHSIASGQYHWRLNEGVNLGGSLPKDVPVYTDLLAGSGYTIGFSRKGTAPSKLALRGNDPFGTKFRNFEEFLSNRPPENPFCFWYGAGEPHRPYRKGIGKEKGIDQDQIIVPPFLPDVSEVRNDLADYYATIERFDRDVGEIVEQLRRSNEYDNTLIIISGDNGMPFPRAKATLYDAGLRVPLVLHWPDRFSTATRRVNELVSLIDLAPTILETTGLPIPPEMDGISLLSLVGENADKKPSAKREFLLAGLERHVYPNPSRAIRNHNFLYIRNFHPSTWPTGLQGVTENLSNDFASNGWPTTPGSFSFNIDPSPTKQWMRRHGKEGPRKELHDLAFAQRPAEELYDLRKDPYQLKNLARSKEHAELRKRLSTKLSSELRSTGDPRYSRPGHLFLQIYGWDIYINDSLWDKDSVAVARMIELLTLQLDRVQKSIPKAALKSLRSVPIWVNPQYETFREKAEYHPNRNWLEQNGRNPEMEKAVEITNTFRFPFENRRMPFLLLHELAHAYHDQIIGWDDPDILQAYEKAKESGKYQSVLRWTGRATKTNVAYAISNPKEYFAESTEAYFGKNDFFPFNKTELKQHDPEIYRVIEEKWGVHDKPAKTE